MRLAGGTGGGAGDGAGAGMSGTSRLGPRQQALLAELRTASEAGQAGDATAPELAARHGASALAGLVRRGLVEIDVREAPRRPLAERPAGRRGARPAGSELSPEQAAAVEAVERAAAAGEARTLLLDGVTGGGKTAIYVELLAGAIARGRPALVLVPEIALALPLVDRLRADLDARVAIVHSGLADGERADEWRRIRRGDVDVVVGTRLAVLAPLADVGLVIVDEEHDPAYKSDRTPRLQARDVALELGRLAGVPVVLGSATPSVETEGRARDGDDRAAPAADAAQRGAAADRGRRPPRRAQGRQPRDALAIARGRARRPAAGRAGDPRHQPARERPRSCCAATAATSRPAPTARGRSSITRPARRCGAITAVVPGRCPRAARAAARRGSGTWAAGTERLEREVKDRFPGLRVGRLDRDVVERRGAADRVVDDFTDGRLDVLVGTSLVTKGLDIPAVTLVGIVSADVALNLPDERAAERTYQLLAQAVGRAGRGDRPGTAILQTYQPEHPAIVAVAERRAEAFYDAELDLRRRFGSPPFGRLVKLTVALQDRGEAQAAGEALVEQLRARAEATGERVDVAGPAPAFIARRGDRWRFNVVLRGAGSGSAPRRSAGRAVVDRRRSRVAPVRRLNAPLELGPVLIPVIGRTIAR